MDEDEKKDVLKEVYKARQKDIDPLLTKEQIKIQKEITAKLKAM